MNYNEAIAYIHSTNKFGRKLGLDNIKALLEAMGNPHKALKVIHVAGTNGKGSTSSLMASILMKAGYQVGLFSSPFLQVFNERIRFNGENIPNEDLALITSKVKEKVDELVARGGDHPTEFEIVTAIAFAFYQEKQADYVVLEVGMGGRLDSTNVVEHPLAAVITPIAMDHMDYLGSDLSTIAGEKAGIIKENCLVVMHPQEAEAAEKVQLVASLKNATLLEVATSSIEIKKTSLKGSKFSFLGQDYKIKLIGDHQTRNAAVAITTIKALRDKGLLAVTDEAIKEGIKEASWPGRLEILQQKPTIIIDGAHNVHSALSLRQAIERNMKDKKVIGVIGMLEDKDVDGVLKTIVPVLDKVVATEPNSDRRLSHLDLARKIEAYGKTVEPVESITQSVRAAKMMANEEDVILFFGSLYMIGEVRSVFTR